METFEIALIGKVDSP